MKMYLHACIAQEHQMHVTIHDRSFKLDCKFLCFEQYRLR